MPCSSSPNHMDLDLSDPTTIYHVSQTSKTDTKTPRHAALAEQFPEQFFGKNVATAAKTEQTPRATATTTTNIPVSPSSTSSSNVDVFETLVHGHLYHPHKTSNKHTSTVFEKEINPSFHNNQRRTSVSSTATTATSSSISSTASTLAASKQKNTTLDSNSAHMDARKSSEIDIFDYQVAGYLSMGMNHVDQPCNNRVSCRKSSAASSSSSSATSGSNSSSLWKRAKGKFTRMTSTSGGSASVDSDGSDTEKEEKTKEQKKQIEYRELGLEQKTKFGIKGGMSIVG